MQIVNRNRIEWIDICKAVLIFLVVLAHVDKTDVSSVYISGFRMPLFFFLSGMVFNSEKYTFQTFFKSRFNGLIIPYILFYLLTYLYWLIIERHIRPLGMEWWHPFIGLLYGAGPYMAHNGILWFIPCMFVIQCLFFTITKVIKRQILKVMIVVAMVFCGFYIKPILPWSINIALVCLPFFAMGVWFKDIFLKEYAHFKMLYILLISSISYFLIQGLTQNRVGIVSANYGDIWIFEIAAILGIVMMCMCFKILIPRGQHLSLVETIGRNTIVIFALHGPLLRVLRYISQYIFPTISIETNILLSLIISMLTILLLYPIIPIYNRIKTKYLARLFLR